MSQRTLHLAIVIMMALAGAAPAQNTNRTVLVPVSITGGKNEPNDLKQENFQLLEDNKEQKISSFSPPNSPLSIGIILGGGALAQRTDAVSQRIINAIKAFQKSSNESNEYFVEPYGQDGAEGTINRALTKLAQGSSRRRILIVVIDSHDNPGNGSSQSSMETIQKQDVPVYFFFVTNTQQTGQSSQNAAGRPATPNPRLSQPVEVDTAAPQTEWLNAFQDAARNTGGRLIYLDLLKDMTPDFVKLAEELKSQYVLGFTSSNTALDGKWRNLKVNVTMQAGQSKLTVRNKSRYFVPKAGSAGRQ